MKLPIVACTVGLLACGGTSSAGSISSSDSTFAVDAYASIASAQNAYRIEIRTAPEQPPGRGAVGVRLTVKTASGAPADGLTIGVVPWMPAHGHGSAVGPTVSAEGDGVYEVENLYLFMPGDWELRMSIEGKEGGDRATASITVQ
jgi:hypothetical protein